MQFLSLVFQQVDDYKMYFECNINSTMLLWKRWSRLQSEGLKGLFWCIRSTHRAGLWRDQEKLYMTRIDEAAQGVRAAWQAVLLVKNRPRWLKADSKTGGNY